MLIYLLIIGGMLFFATLFLRKPRVDDTQVEEGVDYSTTVTSQKKEITSEPTQEQI